MSAQIADADRVKMDAAGVPLEASLSVGVAHRNVVRTIAWVVDRSHSSAEAGSTPASRATSRELPEWWGLAGRLPSAML